MPRFNAPPPNGDSRKAIEQRAREATRPAEPEKRQLAVFRQQIPLWRGTDRQFRPGQKTGLIRLISP